MENLENFSQEEPRKRPTLLTVACILSFVGSGMLAFFGLFPAIFYDTMIQSMEAMVDQDGSGILAQSYELILKTSPAYYVCTSLVAAVSLIGVIYMWKLKKIGFHIYTTAQILLLAIPFLFKISGMQLSGILYTIIFVALYASQLSKMD